MEGESLHMAWHNNCVFCYVQYVSTFDIYKIDMHAYLCYNLYGMECASYVHHTQVILYVPCNNNCLHNNI